MKYLAEGAADFEDVLRVPVGGADDVLADLEGAEERCGHVVFVACAIDA